MCFWRQATSCQSVYGSHFFPTKSAKASQLLLSFLMSLATAQLTTFFCWSRSLSNPFGCETLVCFRTATFCRTGHFSTCRPILNKCSGIPSSIPSTAHLIRIDPCYKVPKNLAGWCLCPSVSWQVGSAGDEIPSPRPGRSLSLVPLTAYRKQ